MLTSGTNEFPPRPPVYELPDNIAGHLLLRCIGEGSYGKVFLARNELTGVYRAIKVVFRGAFRDARPYQREFEAICRFEPISRSHPGFVQILQAGKLDDAFYYIMEVADDAAGAGTMDPERYLPRTLRLYRGQTMPIERCIEIGSTLADCLAVLHENKLIHRDIKPSNIIFVNGSPKLADIGLVAQIDEANSMVGTAGFMPPEGPVSAQSDIYSLGKVLYEISTGKDRCEFPELPDQITTENTLQLELNQILLRACEPHAEKRYATARELRHELELLHAGRSIKRLRHLERRFRTLRIVFAVTAILAIVSFVIYLRVEAKRDEAARERQRQAGSLLAQGTFEMRNGFLSRALPYFVRAAELDPRDMRSHQLRVGSVLSMAPTSAAVWKSGPNAEFSDDGKWVISPKENRVEVFESVSGRRIESHLTEKPVQLAKISRDRAQIGGAGGEHLVIINRERGDSALHKFGSAIVDFEFVPNGKTIALAFADKTACFYDPASRETKWFPGGTSISSIAFDAAGARMVTTFGTQGESGFAQVRDGKTAEIIGKQRSSRYPYRAVFSPDGALAVVCGWGNATPMAVSTGELAGDIMDNDDAVMHAAFSPSGKLLATASYDGTVRLWEVPPFNALRINHILEHPSRPQRVAFIDDDTLVSRCTDGATHVWKLGAQKVNAVVIPNEPKPDPLKIDRAEAQLHASGNRITGNVRDREINLTFPSEICALALSPAGDALAAGSKDSLFEITEARLYRMEKLDRPIDLHHRDGINYVTFSNAGDKLVTCSEDFSAILWDARTGVQIGKPMRHRWQVIWASFSSDDKWVATVGWDDSCMVWDAVTGEPLTVPIKIDEALERVAFAPGDDSLLIRGRKSMYRLDLPFAPLPLAISASESAAPLALSDPAR